MRAVAKPLASAPAEELSLELSLPAATNRLGPWPQASSARSFCLLASGHVLSIPGLAIWWPFQLRHLPLLGASRELALCRRITASPPLSGRSGAPTLCESTLQRTLLHSVSLYSVGSHCSPPLGPLHRDSHRLIFNSSIAEVLKTMASDMATERICRDRPQIGSIGFAMRRPSCVLPCALSSQSPRRQKTAHPALFAKTSQLGRGSKAARGRWICRYPSSN